MVTVVNKWRKFLDMRTRADKNFIAYLEKQKELKNTKFLGWANSFYTFFRKKGIKRISNIQLKLKEAPEIGYDSKRNYREKPLANCICGNGLKKVYWVDVSFKEGEAKTRKLLGRFEKMPIGPKHWEVLPGLFEALGDKNFAKKIAAIGPDETKAVEDHQEKAKDVQDFLSKKLPNQFIEDLYALGIDPEALSQVPELFKYGPDILREDRATLEHLLTPANRRSFFNWFSDSINSGKLDDYEDIIDTYKRLQSPGLHKVNKDSVARMIAFSYQYRTFDRDGLIGNLKKEIKYVQEKASNGKTSKHWLVKKVGDVSRNREIRPASFIIEESPEKLKLEALLEGEEKKQITIAEAVGLRQAYSNMDTVRKEFNEHNHNKYFENRSQFNSALKLLEIEIKKDKKELSKQKGKWKDENLKFSKSAYSDLKKVFEYATLERGTKRANLVKFVPINLSEDLFRRVYVENQKIKWAKSINAAKARGMLKGSKLKGHSLAWAARNGIRKGNYIPTTDIKYNDHLDLEKLVDFATGIVPDLGILSNHKPASYAPKEKKEAYEAAAAAIEEWNKRTKGLKKFVRDLEPLIDSVKFGLVPEEYITEARAKSWSDAEELFKDYKPIDPELQGKLDFLISLRGPLGYKTDSVRMDGAHKTRKGEEFDINKFENARFVTDQQKKVIDQLYAQLHERGYGKYKSARSRCSLIEKRNALKNMWFELYDQQMHLASLLPIKQDEEKFWNESYEGNWKFAKERRIRGSKATKRETEFGMLLDSSKVEEKYKILKEAVELDVGIVKKLREILQQHNQTIAVDTTSFDSLLHWLHKVDVKRKSIAKKPVYFTKKLVSKINELYKKALYHGGKVQRSRQHLKHAGINLRSLDDRLASLDEKFSIGEDGKMKRIRLKMGDRRALPSVYRKETRPWSTPKVDYARKLLEVVEEAEKLDTIQKEDLIVKGEKLYRKRKRFSVRGIAPTPEDAEFCFGDVRFGGGRGPRYGKPVLVGLLLEKIGEDADGNVIYGKDDVPREQVERYLTKLAETNSTYGKRGRLELGSPKKPK